MPGAVRFARVGIDYHVEVEGFFYSVPHALIREQVDTRATARTVEIFHRGKRVASHARRYGGPRHGYFARSHAQRAPALAANGRPNGLRARPDIGPDTEALILAVLARRPHPEQGFRTCLGVLRLFRGLDAARAEATKRAIARATWHQYRRSRPVHAALPIDVVAPNDGVTQSMNCCRYRPPMPIGSRLSPIVCKSVRPPRPWKPSSSSTSPTWLASNHPAATAGISNANEKSDATHPSSADHERILSKIRARLLDPDCGTMT